MAIFVCACCGVSEEMTDEEFEEKDWEKTREKKAKGKEPAIESKILCNLCPEFYTTDLAIEDHGEVHSNWDSWGRPDKFSRDSCLLEDDKKEVEKIAELGGKLYNEIPLSEKKLVSSSLRSAHYHDKRVRKQLRDWQNAPRENVSIWV